MNTKKNITKSNDNKTGSQTALERARMPAIAPMAPASRESTVSKINKGGRPTLYTPETIDRLLSALSDGLTIKQGCLATGISQSVLSDWRERYPDLESRMMEAREQARQKALAGIKAAGEAGDWRAWEAFLRMSFRADYAQQPNTKVEVSTAAQAATVVCTEEERMRLIKLREQIAKGGSNVQVCTEEERQRLITLREGLLKETAAGRARQ